MARPLVLLPWGTKILDGMYRFFQFKNWLLSGREAAV
jgi:hypothetical protein